MSRRNDVGERADRAMLATHDWNDDPWDAALGVSELEPARRQGRVGRWIGFGAIALAIALILGGGAYGMRYVRQANPGGEANALVQFTVESGDTLQTVSERLEAEGFIVSAAFFRTYVNDNGGLDAIEPGLYLLRPRDHVGNILGRLRTSPQETKSRITFPEGFTVEQMANRLARSEDLPQFDADLFVQQASDPTIPATLRPEGVTSLEGLLFPATYDISNADTERQIIERMVDNMQRVAGLLAITSPDPDIAQFTPYQILTVASIIEREAKTERDRPLISRVIYNRLALGRNLQVDATLLYKIDPAAGIDGSDLQPGDIDTLQQLPGPYNSYLNAGLPPTPISNPGEASIEAALHPAPDVNEGDSRCRDRENPGNEPGQEPCRLLFYVIDDAEGNHSFWVTAAQHAEASQKAKDAGLL